MTEVNCSYRRACKKIFMKLNGQEDIREVTGVI